MKTNPVLLCRLGLVRCRGVNTSNNTSNNIRLRSLTVIFASAFDITVHYLQYKVTGVPPHNPVRPGTTPTGVSVYQKPYTSRLYTGALPWTRTVMSSVLDVSRGEFTSGRLRTVDYCVFSFDAIRENRV